MKRQVFAIRIAMVLSCIAPAALWPSKVYAQTLPQLVEQLRANPADDALRNQVIEKALATRPPPAIPEEARRFLGRGIAAFKVAKSPADYSTAIAEFQKASDAAPWWGDPYFNLGQAFEQAGDPAAAMRAYKLYLVAVPKAEDAGKVQSKLYELEFLAEKKSKDDSTKLAADAAKAQKQRWATDIVTMLTNGYSAPVQRASLCLAPVTNHFCTEDEAKGNNWGAVHHPATGSTDWLSSGSRFTFRTFGAENEQVQIKPPDDRPICGTPTGSSFETVVWADCDRSKGSALEQYIWLGISRDNRPIINIRSNCEGQRCRRIAYVLGQ